VGVLAPETGLRVEPMAESVLGLLLVARSSSMYGISSRLNGILRLAVMTPVASSDGDRDELKLSMGGLEMGVAGSLPPDRRRRLSSDELFSRFLEPWNQRVVPSSSLPRFFVRSRPLRFE
jgi:hypothetical protein